MFRCLTDIQHSLTHMPIPYGESLAAFQGQISPYRTV